MTTSVVMDYDNHNNQHYNDVDYDYDQKQINQDSVHGNDKSYPQDLDFQTNSKDKFVCIESFEHMKLKVDLLRGIFGYGWERPSPIQKRAIMPIINKHDVIIQAQSGTGKTGTFSIASLQRINPNNKQCQILILSPTRELAQQSHSVITKLGHYLNITTRCCVGGTPERHDIKALIPGIQIVVGTPGRIYSMINKNVLKLQSLELFILDEADIMLSKGFIQTIANCFGYIPQTTQVALVSATMPNEIISLTNNFMSDPIEILVKKEQLTLDGIRQYYIAVKKEDYKLDTIIGLYKELLNINQAIIFVNKKHKAQWLCDKLKQNEFVISVIHGDMKQFERELVMKEFRSGSTRILIATDILARGIDVQNISLVINYDLPINKETYIHRIGRSGRYGRKGLAINFVKDDEEDDFNELKKFYQTIIDELPAKINNLI